MSHRLGIDNCHSIFLRAGASFLSSELYCGLVFLLLVKKNRTDKIFAIKKNITPGK